MRYDETELQVRKANVKLCLYIVIPFILLSIPTSAAILIEDGKPKEVKTSRVANDGIEMRALRRVGIGLTGAGPLGVAGANLELNFTPRWGVGAGFGGGGLYQAYTFQVKKVLAGEWLLPYMSFGYARWYTARHPEGPIVDTNPEFLADRFLSDRQKSEGEFAVNLIYPSFGLQYMQLSGDYAGLSVFAEIVVLLEVEDFQAVPTGTVGMFYYF
jgi:hypothetical protein